jgi:hypothetical protein
MMKAEICMKSEAIEVIEFDDANIYLYNEWPDDNGETILHSIEMSVKDFKKNFALNYCSTTHKERAKTITDNFTIYHWNRMRVGCKCAMSRAKIVEQRQSYPRVAVCVEIKDKAETFQQNKQRKNNRNKTYVTEANIDVKYVMNWFKKQHGECLHVAF